MESMINLFRLVTGALSVGFVVGSVVNALSQNWLPAIYTLLLAMWIGKMFVGTFSQDLGFELDKEQK